MVGACDNIGSHVVRHKRNSSKQTKLATITRSKTCSMYEARQANDPGASNFTARMMMEKPDGHTRVTERTDAPEMGGS